MTKKQWFKIFKQELEVLPRKERRSAIEYYQELFNEKSDAGLTEAEILQSIDTPTSIAEEIILSGNDIADAETLEYNRKKVRAQKKILGVSGYMVLIAFTAAILCLAVYIAMNGLASVFMSGSATAIVVLFIGGAVTQFALIALPTLIVYGIYRAIKSFKKSKETRRDDKKRMV